MVTTLDMEAPFRLVERLQPYSSLKEGVVHAIRWAVQRARYMALETIEPLSNNSIASLPAVAD